MGQDFFVDIGSIPYSGKAWLEHISHKTQFNWSHPISLRSLLHATTWMLWLGWQDCYFIFLKSWVQNTASKLAIFAQVVQFPYAHAKPIPHIRLQQLPSTSFPIHYSLHIIQHYTIWANVSTKIIITTQYGPLCLHNHYHYTIWTTVSTQINNKGTHITIQCHTYASVSQRKEHQHPLYWGADKSLARRMSWCVLFDASLVIYINSTNIPPVMIINRIYEHQNLLSL